MPVFREMQFLSANARLTFPIPITDAVYDSPRGKNNIDLALRWSQSFGDWDVALSNFNRTSREPRLLPGLLPGLAGLTPFYDQINQSALDLQYTSGNWLWKLEAISRSGQGPQFWAAVGGFEWTLFGILGTSADFGLCHKVNIETN